MADHGARHRSALRRAEARLAEAQEVYDRAVTEAQEQLTAAGRDLEVMTLGDDIWLGRLSVVVEGREHVLSGRTRFRVEVTGRVEYRPVQEDGEVRVRLHDRRRAGLYITDPHWHEHVDLKPDPPDSVHRFVSAGQAVVRTLDAAWRERDRRIALARDQLAQARGRTEDLDLARMTWEDLSGAGPHRSDLAT